MSSPNHPPLSRALVVLSLTCSVLIAACGTKSKDPTSSNRSYTARGLVEQLPGTSGSLYIRHEAIPGFVTSSGKKMDMKSMSMGFFVGDTSIDGIAAKDKVTFTFRTDWALKPALRLVKIAKLPADTKLSL